MEGDFLERRDRILPSAIIFLGLAILVSGYWVSHVLNEGLQGTSYGLSNLAGSINNATFQPSQPVNSTPKIKDKEILDLSEAEQFLGITGEEMYKIMDVIPHVSIGNKYLYSKMSLIDWVEKSNYTAESK